MITQKLYRRSFLFLFLFISFMQLNAQEGVVIKEKVTINPQTSSNAPLQSEVQPSLTIVMPFNGIAKITIYAYYVWGDPCVIMNGQEIIHGVVSQWPKWDIPLGEFTQGQSLTFTVQHYSEGSVWPGEISKLEGVPKPDCFEGYWMSYTEDCNCGTDCYCYLYLVVDFYNTTTEKYLEGDWWTSVVHGEATSLTATYTDKCWEYAGGTVGYLPAPPQYPLPEGTTFTFSITDGSQYGTLYAPQTGAIGSVVSGLPQNNGTCSVIFMATGMDPSEPVSATVEVQTTAAGVNMYSGPVIIYPGPGKLKVTPTKSSILYGESLTFNVTKMVDGLSVPLPEGTWFSYTITSGADAGYLFGGDASGDEIYGEFSSVNFTAVEETPQGQSTQVSVWVQAWEPGGIILGSVKTKPVAGEDLQVMNQPKIPKVGLGEFQQYTMQKNTDGTITYEIKNQTGCDTAQKSVNQAKSTAMQKTVHGTISHGARIQARPRIKSSILGTTSEEKLYYVGGATVTVKKKEDDENHPPVIESITYNPSRRYFAIDSLVTVTAQATDPDGDAVTISYLPSQSFKVANFGPNIVTVTAKDSKGAETERKDTIFGVYISLSPGYWPVKDGENIDYKVNIIPTTILASSFQWSWEPKNAPAGNLPKDDFLPDKSHQKVTVNNAWWYAFPNVQCPPNMAKLECTYKLNAKVIIGEDEFNSNNEMVVYLPQKAGEVTPPKVIGTPNSVPLLDANGNLISYRIYNKNFGSLTRDLRLPTYYILESSQFYHKTYVHEMKHIEQWKTGMFKDLFLVSNFFNIIKEYSAKTLDDLSKQVINARTKFNNSEGEKYLEKRDDSEIEAYDTADPIPPLYLYQRCGQTHF